ncbi:MAG: putative membrane protein SpoIIM required for sporulation [Gammaproteobacteria bacterium]|jgi:uncharacterized membrane protein SpoIIM required for sporulation
MNQREFVERYTASWQSYEDMLDHLARRRRRASSQRSHALAEFPFLYRQLCQQLALARDRNYSSALVDRLNVLVLRGHRSLYRARPGTLARLLRFVTVDFPTQLRADAKIFWIASALLYLPAIALFVAIMLNGDLAYGVMSAAQASNLEQMYDPESEHFARERASDSDFLMFGFYIKNNIGIGFQTFAGGLLFGVGSVFYLVFNGLFLGAAAAHLYLVGFAATFSAFVITHGAFELTAIVIAGTAGLKLGLALIAPGRRRRAHALTHAARESVILVFGLAGMLVIAAFVEAYWSSSTTVPAQVKYAIGGLCWLLVGYYFLRAGRRQ